MIIKVLARHANFRGAITYVLERPRTVEPEILDGTLAGGTAAEMAKHTEYDAARRPDIEKPVWHAVISWHADDHPDHQQMQVVTEGLMQRLKLDPAKHGFVAVIHRDTDEPHVHLIVNRVSDEGKVWTGEFDARVAQAYRREIDQTYGWTKPEGRGKKEDLVEALKAPESENRSALRAAKHEVHTAINRAIASSDGTFASFVTTCERQGDIIPALSFDAKGRFNGSSFTLLNAQGLPEAGGRRAETDPHREPQPLIFKGSQVAWPKDKLETALAARRDALAHQRADVPTNVTETVVRSLNRQQRIQTKRKNQPKAGRKAPKGKNSRRWRRPFLKHVQRDKSYRSPFFSDVTWSRLQAAARLMDQAVKQEVGDDYQPIVHREVTSRGPSR